MYKYLISIIIFSIHTMVFPQETTKIFILKEKTEDRTLEADYLLNSPKDSIFIDFEYSGDFGHIIHVNYKLKDRLPDGKYEVYVNDRLAKEAFFRNGLKDSVWTEYDEKGGMRKIPYVQDTVNGSIIDYYKDGKVRRITNIDKGTITWRETYSPEKVIRMKEVYRNRKIYKVIKYNQTGKIIEEKYIP